jgi:thiol-disulfide isomerase/thioredoxin
LAVLAIPVIVAISAPLSSADAVAARAGDTGIEKFQPTHPPVPGPTTPFYENGEVARTLADYRGKVVVLNFWAVWCAPCRAEMPALDRLNGKIESEGAVVIPLSLDRGGAKVARNFYESHDIETLPIMVDKGRKLTREAGVQGLPTTILIDRDGNEVGRLEGPAAWDSPEAVGLIRSYLGSPGRSAVHADAQETGILGWTRRWVAGLFR